MDKIFFPHQYAYILGHKYLVRSTWPFKLDNENDRKGIGADLKLL